MNALVAILIISGISALAILVLSLVGKFSDKMWAITQVDPQRGRRISIMILVASFGLLQLLNLFDRPAKPQPLNVDSHLKLIHSVRPVYPPLARQARVQGKVRFAAVIGVDGQVEELKLIEGNPLLVPAAREAASQWVLSKPTARGKPVKAKTEIDVNFHLDSSR
jgi:hypothetical protein